MQHSSSHAKSTHAWSKVHHDVVDALLSRHASVYRRCRKTMINLGADEVTLSRYQPLKDGELKVSSVATSPNARGNRNECLAWCWTMDVSRDTESSDWMSECMFSKAMRDRWREEEELLPAEFKWTIGFFNHQAKAWNGRTVHSVKNAQQGLASYAAQQETIYCRLRDQCQVAWETIRAERLDGAESSRTSP
ncbi:hypothetical protein OG21DRAFT_1420111 [Imleria badia]|nr:hypothetical protein OG21DRAFT_1420111 [Imleria badia]